MKVQVWDMDSGQCAQTVQPAHQGVVMSLLAWQVGPVAFKCICAVLMMGA